MAEVTLISGDYRKMNAFLHQKHRFYGRGSAGWAQMVEASGYKDVLDYGCGKGALAKHLSFPIKEYDPGIEEKSELPGPADFIVCTDVLEHVEPECLDGVLLHIKELARKRVFFSVATRPAHKELPDGRNAHLIIQSTDWWMTKLTEYFVIEVFKSELREEGEFSVMVIPKRGKPK